MVYIIIWAKLVVNIDIRSSSQKEIKGFLESSRFLQLWPFLELYLPLKGEELFIWICSNFKVKVIGFFSVLYNSLWPKISHVKVLERPDGEYCDPPTSLNNQSIEHPIRTTVNYSRVIFPCFGYGIHVLYWILLSMSY